MYAMRWKLGLACAWGLWAVHVQAQTPAPAKPADAALTIELRQKPWSGDLDGMIERRTIRVLTTHSRTSFFVDKGVNRGLVPDAMHLFENELNKQLAAEKKLKNKNLKVRPASTTRRSR